MMYHNNTLRWMIVLLVALGGALTIGSRLRAEPPTTQPEDVKAATDKETDNADKAKKPVDPYAVPDGGVDELLEFIESLENIKAKNLRQALEHRQKALPAMKEAAEKILELEKDANSDAAKKASLILLMVRTAKAHRASDQERRELFSDVKKMLQEKEPKDLNANDAGIAMAISRVLSRGNKNFAIEVNRSLGDILAKGSKPRVKTIGTILQGTARRLDLLGKPIRIEGTTIDGKPFDWDSYRGKVVLVDFWATWCGPCRAEIPNVKKYYELYHDRGFDVVGISVDRKKAPLDKYLEKQKLPWVTLYTENGRNPTATYYGVSGIPTVFLVDREGKVVSLNARGRNLGRLLKELIGPPKDEKKPPAKGDAVDKVSL